MLPVLTASNFKGWVDITTNISRRERLEAVILDFTRPMTISILGAAATEEIELSDPLPDKWSDLLNGGYFTDCENTRMYFSGVTLSLVYFIYFEFMRENFTPSAVGNVKTENVNSARIQDHQNMRSAVLRYNLAAKRLNEELDSFLKAHEEIRSQVTAQARTGDIYTLTVTNTLYLVEGDELKTVHGNFTVSAVTHGENSGFISFSTSRELDFTGSEISWKPFEKVVFNPIKPVVF